MIVRGELVERAPVDVPMMDGPMVLVRDAFLVLVRQWRVVLAIYLGIVATAVTYLFVATPQYRVASKVLVTSNRADISTSEEKPTELLRTPQVAQGELNAQAEIVRSRALIATVLQDMGVTGQWADTGVLAGLRSVLGMPAALITSVYRRLHGLDRDQPDQPFARAVAGMAEATEATAVRGSNVIEVALTSPDPWFARDYVDRLTAAYVDLQSRLQRDSNAEHFFTTQSELLHEKLGASENALRAARERAGALAGQQEQVRARLSEFDAELARARIARQEQERRLAFLEKDGGASARVATPELLSLEGRRAELIGRYRAGSERMKEVDQQIRELRAAISRYQSVVGTTQGDTDVFTVQSAIAGLKGKEEALTRERETAHRQAEELDADSYELTRLERQVKLDEQAYLSYVRTTEESRLANALQQSSMLQLSIIEPASVPSKATSPRFDLVLMLALVGGLVIAVAVALARDRLDPTLKTVSDVRRYGALEVLAVLPER